MSGFCDLHCHLLHGLDDGARTVEDSLAMARALVELGFTTCAPSPHARAEYAVRAVAESRLEEVRAVLARENVPLELAHNAENYFLEPDFLASLESGEFRCVGGPGEGARHVLVEAPYHSPLPNLPELIFRLKLKGVTPLIAHPERCFEFIRKGRAAELVEAGALLQLDIGSLIGRYGKSAKKVADGILDAGLYAVAATDMHSPVGARDWLGRAFKALRSEVGEVGMQTLLATNPRKLLRGEVLAS